MPVHRDNQEVNIMDGNGEPFPARVSHSEEQGKHTFVITADEENMPRLESLRGDISNKIKEDHGIKNNADLSYVERHPNVDRLYEVNLDNQGPGPGKYGEPEHLKDRGQWVSQEKVQEQLGNTEVPKMEQQNDVDLKEASMPHLNQAERTQEQQFQMQNHQQKHKMKM